MDALIVFLGIIFGSLFLLVIAVGIAAAIGADKWHVAAEGKLARAEYVPHRTVVHFDDGRMFLTRDAMSMPFTPGSRIRIMENGNGAHRFEKAD
jgi:hypothetical protein